MLLQRGVVLPRKSVKKPRSTPVARGVITGIKLREAEEKAKKEGLAKGLAEGRAEGRAEGMTESKTETAKRLAQMGLTIDQIAKAVDASKEDVQEWITMPRH